MAKITIAQADQADRFEIDQFLVSSADSLPYQHIEWLEAIKQVYGYNYLYLIAREGGTMSGVLPICIFKGLLGKKFYCSLPFCDVGGAVATSDKVKQALISYSLGQLGSDNSQYLEIRQRSGISNEQEDFTNRKVSMLLSLPTSAGVLMAGFKSKLRSQIKKAEKNDLIFDAESDIKSIYDFFSVYSRNMHYLGSPVHSIKLFESLHATYRDNFLVGRVSYGNKVVGAGILMFSGKNVSIPWASTLREYNRLAPNMWLYWNLLRISCERGCEVFDFGRSTYQEGSFKFKRQWGANPVLLDWQYLNRSGQSIEYSSSASGKPRQLVESLWKRIPLSLVNFLGPRLRKHISL